MASNISVRALVKDVLLLDQSTWNGWYENIRGSVPDYLWKYFNSDGDAAFVKSIPPVKPVIEPPLVVPALFTGPSTQNTQPSAETSEHQLGRKSKYKENIDIYFKRHTIYRDLKKEWEYYYATQTKLQDKMQATVAKQKAAKLCAHLPIRTWLQDLKASSTLPEATTKRSISVEYHHLINIGLTEWPRGGPGTLLAKWEDLICQAEQFNMTLENWLTEVGLIWQRVPGIAGYFEDIERKVVQRKTDKYTSADISEAIQQYWERRREGTVLKFVQPKATRLVFATGITFDGEEASDIGDSAVTPTTIIKKSQLSDTNTKNRNKKRKINREIRRNNNNTSQLRTYSHRNKSRLPIFETRPHLRRAN